MLLIVWLIVAYSSFYHASGGDCGCTPLYLGGSDLYDAGYSSGGFTAETNDVLGPWNGQSVMIKGTEQGGAETVYNYRIDCEAKCWIQNVKIEGAVGWTNSVIKFFRAPDIVLGSVQASGQDFTSWNIDMSANSYYDTIFYFSETNTDTNTRYRSLFELTEVHIPECDDCNDSDACKTSYCEDEQCMYNDIDCDDNNACTVDSCDPDIGCLHTDIEECDPDIGCLNTDREEECQENTYCDKDSGLCLRDCDTFAIDEYLVQCSAEFESNNNDIDELQGGITTLQSNIDANTEDIGNNDEAITELSTSIGDNTNNIAALNDQISYLLDKVHGFGPVSDANVDPISVDTPYFDLYSKDIIIIVLLLINLISIAISCYVCANNQKQRYRYNETQQTDEEDALKQ